MISRASGRTSANAGPVAEPAEMGVDRDARAAHGVAALPTDRHDRQVARVLGDLARREPDRVRVERSGQAAVGGDQHDQPLAALASDEERMVLAAQDGGQVGQDLVELLGVRPRRQRRVLGTLELARGDELHRPGDLLDVLDRADPAPDVALTSHAYAVTSARPTPPRSDAAPGRRSAHHARKFWR